MAETIYQLLQHYSAPNARNTNQARDAWLLYEVQSDFGRYVSFLLKRAEMILSFLQNKQSQDLFWESIFLQIDAKFFFPIHENPEER